MINFAAETMSIGPLRRGGFRGGERRWRPGPAGGVPGRGGPAGRPGLYRRGLRQRGPGSWTEDATLAPNSPYAAAKAGGRPYGPGVRQDPRAQRPGHAVLQQLRPLQFPEKVIPLFVTNLLDGLAIPFYGDGGNVRGWIHVDDHCRGIQLALERGQRGASTTSAVTWS